MSSCSPTRVGARTGALIGSDGDGAEVGCQTGVEVCVEHHLPRHRRRCADNRAATGPASTVERRVPCSADGHEARYHKHRDDGRRRRRRAPYRWWSGGESARVPQSPVPTSSRRRQRRCWPPTAGSGCAASATNNTAQPTRPRPSATMIGRGRSIWLLSHALPRPSPRRRVGTRALRRWNHAGVAPCATSSVWSAFVFDGVGVHPTIVGPKRARRHHL